MLQLNDYPAAIAHAKMTVLTTRQELRAADGDLDTNIRVIDAQITADDTLKNDGARKAKKAELLSLPTPAAAVVTVQALKDELALVELDLDTLLNQFTVAKLEVRERIADKILAADTTGFLTVTDQTY